MFVVVVNDGIVDHCVEVPFYISEAACWIRIINLGISALNHLAEVNHLR